MKQILTASALTTVAIFSGLTALAQTAPMQNAQTAYIAPFTSPATVPSDLARIDSALNATGTFQGDFTQVAPDGSTSTGKIWLQRPGKMRFEYNAPNPLLIVSDGVTMTQQDKALETFDRVPLSATPLNYFLKENVNLASDTEVIALQKFPTEWRVTARDGSGEMDGAITLVLDAQNLALRQWVISDAFGGQTRVILSNLQYNGRVDPKLFILREDRDRRRDRR